MSVDLMAALSVPAVLVLSAVCAPLVVRWERRHPSAPVVFRERMTAKRVPVPPPEAVVEADRAVRGTAAGAARLEVERSVQRALDGRGSGEGL